MDDDRFDDDYWDDFAIEIWRRSKCSTYIVKVVRVPTHRYISFLVHGRDGDIVYQIEHSWNKDGTPSKPVTLIQLDVSGGKKYGPDVYYADYISLGRFSVWPDSSQYAEDIWAAIERYKKDDD